MARRLFNGRRFSENGWPYVDEGSCTWVTVPGTNGVTLQIQNGPPLVLLRAWAADWNAYIEPLRDADSACWTPGNSVATSNHPGGSAVDLNWNSHPFQKRGSLNAQQMATMAEMEGFYEGNVFWAGRWESPVDEMHSQVGYNTYDQDADAPFPRVFDFIARKIRADGYSTFRRTTPSPTPLDPARILSEAMGGTVTLDRYRSLLPAVSQCLQECDCTTIARIAMWVAQVGHESVGLKYMEEIWGPTPAQQGYEGRHDLGNIYVGDGYKFRGRGPIQVTGRLNYTLLSKWAYQKGLVPTDVFFATNPDALASDQYGFMGVTWYWVTQRPMNDAADAGDIETASVYVNGRNATTGRANGIADRIARYNRALSMGDRLLALLQEDDMFTDDDRLLLRQISEIRRPSLSPFRWPGEGPVNTCAGFAWSADGNVHIGLVEKLAVTYGDPQHVAMLIAVASCAQFPAKYPDRQADAVLAARILTKVDEDAHAAGEAYLKAWFDAEKAQKTG